TTAKQIGHLNNLIGGMFGPDTHEYGDLLARIENVCRVLEISLGRHHTRRRVANTCMNSIRGVRWLLNRVHLLHILWNDDAGHGTFGGGDTHGTVNELTYLD